MYSRLAGRILTIAAVLAFVSAGLAQEAPKKPAKPEPPKAKNIVDTAKEQKLTTFCTLVEKAGLTETLGGKGPYTVFAPTDEAFNKLGKEKLENLQKPENKAELQRILKNHILAAEKTAAEIQKMKEAETMAGTKLMITVKDNTVMIETAKVAKPDVKAGNGLIHVVDAVLMPE